MPRRARALRLTSRGWTLLAGAIVILTIATFANRREGLYVAAFLTLVVIASAIAVRLQRPSVEIERRFPTETPAGEEIEVTDIIRAISHTTSIVGWRERVPVGWGEQPQGLLPVTLAAPGRRAGIRYTVRPRKRGVYELGPLRLRVRDPLGLAEAERTVGAPAEVTVLPRVSNLHDVGLSGADGDGKLRERNYLAAPRVDELIAREYRAGDPIRRVHWRATARHGELMVRQEEPQGDPEAVLVLMLAPGSDALVVEAVVELCASVAAHMTERGYRVTLVEPGESRLTSVMPTELAALLTRLAVCGPVAGGADAVEFTRAAFDGVAAPIPLVVFSTSAEHAATWSPLVTLGRPAAAFVAADASAEHALADEGWRVAGVYGSDRPMDVWERIALSSSEVPDAAT
ncbi:Uncharacterized conserved protein, DUF58 family, contains vWF domain [Paramicrobacterium humi]|uniref:Uncharacterized conserved protein, DUF58 family, contains vWF domain n=1 Tax=Paramicrobacterium humi TaxID=640635 RepID=A0A1H4TK41_9MICO|nr:DUF58 domain-containing protein [Microbacterium humi]SEC56767.1 Uncharacterized conserved protein, DUF58 family, contains vWF domain [Microbacterium humi]